MPDRPRLPVSTPPSGRLLWLRPALLALTPSRWALAALALFLGLRLLGWHLTRVGQFEAPPLRELVKGVVWDAALLAAPLAWLRWLAFRGSMPLRLPIAAAIAGAVVLRWVDLAHCLMVGAHWSQDAFLYVDKGFFGSLLDPRIASALAVAGLTAMGAAWLALRDSPPVRAAGQGRGASLAVHLAAAVASLAAAWAVRDALIFAPHLHHPRLTPELNWLVQAGRAYSDPSSEAQVPQPPASSWAKWQELGLVAANSSANSPFPLLRSHLEIGPLPYPRRPGVDARPNVVLTLMESVNSLFIHELSGRYRGLMPEMGKLAGQMTRVDGLYNTTSPTIAAMVSVLCSIHPSTHPADLSGGNSVAGNAAYTCISDLLRAEGYRAVFVQAALGEITGKEKFLRQHGFDEVHGLAQLVKRFPQAGAGPWGPHDDTLVAYTQETIERLEAQRAKDGRPFLLVMLTLDTHDPGMAGPECDLPRLADGTPAVSDLPASERARKLLASYHCSDRAIGSLGRFLLSQERRDHTLWMATADHAAFVGLTPEEIYPTAEDRRDFAPIPWLIHDPVHQLPKRISLLAGSRDLAPTLLHLLNASDQPNSLTGHSIFGSRPHFQYLVGRIGDRLAFVHDGMHAVQLPTGVVRDRCHAGRPLDERLDGRLAACDLSVWLDWQDSLWASHRLFPLGRLADPQPTELASEPAYDPTGLPRQATRLR